MHYANYKIDWILHYVSISEYVIKQLNYLQLIMADKSLYISISVHSSIAINRFEKFDRNIKSNNEV